MAERIASLISGEGTTMAKVVSACKRGEIPGMEIGCIVSSHPHAGGIERARQAGIPDEDIVVIDASSLKTSDGKRDTEALGLLVLKELTKRHITIVMQHGWKPRTSKIVIDAFPGRIFNQHPGPVPEFGGEGMFGRRVHQAVIEFLRLTGNPPITEVIAQEVAPEFDAGAVVGSARIAVLPDDTAEILQARSLPQEHSLQIHLLRDFLKGKLQPIVRKEPFVRSWQHQELCIAKNQAKALYPKG